jgi:hypothetical protein
LENYFPAKSGLIGVGLQGIPSSLRSVGRLNSNRRRHPSLPRWRGWDSPISSRSAKAESTQAATIEQSFYTLRRGVQGRKAKIDYEAALIEAARFIHEKKPRTHAKVKEHIAEWLGDKAPADSELTKHIGPLCRALCVGD